MYAIRSSMFCSSSGKRRWGGRAGHPREECAEAAWFDRALHHAEVDGARASKRHLLDDHGVATGLHRNDERDDDERRQERPELRARRQVDAVPYAVVRQLESRFLPQEVKVVEVENRSHHASGQDADERSPWPEDARPLQGSHHRGA